ncbi:MAG: TonB-dependent receptor [Gemmatimonadota bacterium]
MVPKVLHSLSMLLLLSLLGTADTLAAQTGTLAGRVVNVENEIPVGGAEVEVLGATGAAQRTAITAADGQFRLSLAPGNYSVIVTRLGFETTRVDGIRIEAGETRDVRIEIRSRALALNPIVVTASRREEKALEAPASVSIVGSERIQERAALSPMEHVRTLPGVDAVQTGLMQSNTVARGFNNVFSGSLLMLTDNRIASVPSLRVNAHNFVPSTDLDLERIEFVLGPGAALYGPNSASGVMHMITSSPIDTPGSSFSLAGGERSIFHGAGRQSVALSDRLGFKISGQYFQGEDWHHVDPAEVAAQEADPDNPRIGARDFDASRWGGEVRLDYRPWDDGEMIFSAGINNSNSIELTGVGAGQAVDWRYSFFQTRLRKGRLFTQFFLNRSDAGDTYLLRSGDPIVDKSMLYVGQIQHGMDVGERQSFTYGVDLQFTRPDTEGTIHGANEDDDHVNEFGGYLHSETRLTDQFDFVAALRLDDHNWLEDVVFSPRAALVFRPAEEQNFRLTFNRAFSTPTSNNLFLDLQAAPLIPALGYELRARGVPSTGFTFDNATGCGGVQDLCMRSPFGGNVQMPADGFALWNTVVGAVVPAPLQPFLMDPDPGEIGSLLRRLDALNDQSGPEDVLPLRPTITNTIEAGYKGLLGERLLLSADVYYSRVNDFVGPLRVETPSVFYNPADVQAFVMARLGPAIGGGMVSPEQAAAVIAGLAGLPVGTVTPDQIENSNPIVTYRNFGDVNFWGSDFGAQFLATESVSFRGSYSWVESNCFQPDGDEVDNDCQRPQDIALNAPRNKGAVSARYENFRHGFNVEGRARFTSGFPMNSGVYRGEVESYGVFDANIGYRLPMVPNASLTLSATNIFDDMRQEFVGAPEIGRLVLLRLMYAF